MADSNIQTLDTVKPITLDEYQERTAHLQENTTSLLSTIADRQVQAAGLATQAASLASEVNAVAEQASLSFSKKTWTDTATSGTPITAAELNRLENAISSLTTAVNNLQDSVSPSFVECNIADVSTTVCKAGKIVVVTVSGTLKKPIGAWDALLLSGVMPMAKSRYNSLLISQDTTDPRILLSVTGTKLFIESKGASMPNGTWTFGQLVYVCE